MFLRALIAVLVLPGMFAGVIPAVIIRSDTHRFDESAWGYALIGMGLAQFAWCVRDFWVSGKGTLAPWNPPKHLVIVGLYRFVRNPMYVALTIFLIGWVLVSGSRNLAIYLAILAVAFHLRVILYEEPRLRRQFPGQWETYSKAVNRWLPSRPSK